MNIFLVVIFCMLKASQETVINVKSNLNQRLKPLDLGETWDPSFNITELVISYGYPFETHPVTTDDGYILELHRIPNGLSKLKSDDKKPAVLIVHDILGSSADFLIAGPENSLPLQLAEQGYDVWLGNNRGNTWSRAHKELDPNKNKTYWDFSFHELGIHDSPAMIDHILNKTGNDKLSFIGYSQGAAQFFVMTSEKPEYNDKITMMTALAPAVYMNGTSNVALKLLSQFKFIVDAVESFLSITEFLPHSNLITIAGGALCKDGSPLQNICITVMSSIVGFDNGGLNKTLLPILFEVFPAGSSIMEVNHLIQGINSGNFRQYDFGVMENLAKYHNGAAPEYNLTKTSIPVALYYGQNDSLIAASDVERLATDLSNVVDKKIIEHFNHADFYLSKNVTTLLNNQIISLLNEHNGKANSSTTTTTPTPKSNSSTRITSSPSLLIFWNTVFTISVALLLRKE